MIQNSHTSGRRAFKYGFTVVELLVVVVIIAILATVAVIAYNGLTQRATGSTLQQDLTEGYKQLQISYGTSGTYPADTSGVKKNAGTTYQYTVNNAANPPYFCLTATNPVLSNGYYVTSQNSVPTAGLCSGHVLNPGSSPSAPVVTLNPAPGTGFNFYDDDPMEYITLSSAATGTPSPTVVWQKQQDSGSWINIPDQTSATFNEPVASSRGYTGSWYDGSRWHGLWAFRAAWTNSAGTTYSSPTGLYTIYGVP